MTEDEKEWTRQVKAAADFLIMAIQSNAKYPVDVREQACRLVRGAIKMVTK